jgi:hypothetical protein
MKAKQFTKACINMKAKRCYICNSGLEVQNVSGRDLCYSCRKVHENAIAALNRLEKLRMIDNLHCKR